MLNQDARSRSGNFTDSDVSKHAGGCADLLRIAVNTAGRRGELLGLRWSQVDLDAGTLKLEGKDAKNAKARIVPLNNQARAALQNRLEYRTRHCPGSPCAFSSKAVARNLTIQSRRKAVLREAGLDDFHFHDLRHTCGSWLVQSGVALADVKEVLGHSTIRMTERYAHNAPETSRAAVERLNTLTQPGLISTVEH